MKVQASAQLKKAKMWVSSWLALRDHQGILNFRNLDEKMKELASKSQRRPEEQELLSLLIEEVNGHRERSQYDQGLYRTQGLGGGW